MKEMVYIEVDIQPMRLLEEGVAFCNVVAAMEKNALLI